MRNAQAASNLSLLGAALFSFFALHALAGTTPLGDGITQTNPDFTGAGVTVGIGITGATTPGTDYDNYTVNNLTTVKLGNNDTLKLTTNNGFVATPGNSFNIFVFTGSSTSTVSGTFTNLDFSAASLSSPLLAAWDVSQLYTTGVITVDFTNDYWTGAHSAVWASNNFATSDSVTGPAQTHGINGISNVFLSATGATNLTSALSTGSQVNFTVNSLNFKGVAGATLNSGNSNLGTPSTLTINATNAYQEQGSVTHSAGIGLVVQAGTGPSTIGSDLNLVLGNNQTWEIDNSPANPLTVNGWITDSSSKGGPALSLTKTGPGVLILADVNGANGYSGGTAVLGGTLQLGSAAILGEGTGVGTLTVSGGTLDINSTGQQVNGISLSSGMIMDSAGGGNILVNAGSPIKDGQGNIIGTTPNNGVVVTGSGTSTLAAVLFDGSDPFTGATTPVPLTKSGSGTLNVLVSQMYSGMTNIAGGVLALSQGTALSSDVNVTGGTLAGDGTVLGNGTNTTGLVTVSAGARVNPGTAGGGAAGTLTLGALKLNPGSILAFNLTANGTGTSSLLNVSGTNTFDVSSLSSGNRAVIQLNPVAGNLIDVPFTNYTWTLVTSTSVVSSFVNDFAINPGTFAAGAQGLFTLSVVGNSLDLNYVGIPEPSTVALLTGLGVLGLVALRRRRSNRR